MSQSVLIVGGGPAGAAAAVSLARHGVAVTLFDDTAPPGNKLQEMLYPEAERLLATLMRYVCPKEPLSVRYVGQDGKTHLRVVLDGEIGSIDRNRLDARLRQTAAEAGAKVLPLSVETFQTHSDGVLVTARGQSFRGAFLIDATGKNPITAHPRARAAFGVLLDRRTNAFSHFENSTGFAVADRTIVAVEGGFAYVLPIREGRVCVGCVNYCDCTGRTPDEFYADQLARCKFLSVLLQGATRCLPVIPAKNVVSAYPGVVGRVVRVGDALGFKDPFLWDGLSFAVETGLASRATVRGGVCV